MLTEYTKFYYHALPDRHKPIYRQLYEGFKSKKKAIMVKAAPGSVTPEDIFNIAISVYNDAPSFYYLDLSKHTLSMTPFGCIYYQKYNYSDEVIAQLDAKLERGLRNFKAKYITDDMTDYDKEKAIHDYLVKTVVYDHEAVETGSKWIDEAFNVIGPLLKKKAVCWGIACAFKLLCDYCKIKSIVALGDPVPKTSDAGHAWNIVKLGDESYHVDVTWDIKEKGDITNCYDYFNLSDKLIRADHTWKRLTYPKCEAITHNYYYKNNLYVKTKTDLTSHVVKRLQAGERYIAVKYANDLPSQDELNMAIRLALQMTSMFGPYKLLVMEKTHNIYLELCD